MMAASHTNENVNRTVLFRIEHVGKSYGEGSSAVHALRKLDLEIYDGEFLVILGPSGSGKSTLLNIVGGIDTVTSGRVFFRNEELSGYSGADLTRYRREHIGFVFQFYNLMPNLTAEENVEMATEISASPMEPSVALNTVGLEERRDHFPAQLSGGEQQRVAIARAVAKRPDILLCDEPTGALDIATGKLVLGVLEGVNRQIGTTVVIITHNSAIGGIADRIVRLHDGTVRDIQINETRQPVEELEW